MAFNDVLFSILKKQRIYDFAVIPFKKEFVLYSHKLKKLGFAPKTVVICLFPYYCENLKTDGALSRYASIPDYHIVAGDMLKAACADLQEAYADAYFLGFVDDSPFLEKDMACFARLCIRGRHDICVNDRYGSLFYIGEIVSNIEFETFMGNDETVCCGAMPCISACPTGAIYIDERGMPKFIKERCLSFISQKSSHTKEDERLFLNSEKAWGCDLCQDACVKNHGLKNTHIEGFLKPVPDISFDDIKNMSDDEFTEKYKDRAFSYKGRKIIKRNLELLDNNRKLL